MRLEPCDYFLWPYLKSSVFDPFPNNFDVLKINIENKIKKVNSDVLKKTILNFSKRCDLVIKAKGGHIGV
jgi:hypothetical protein